MWLSTISDDWATRMGNQNGQPVRGIIEMYREIVEEAKRIMPRTRLVLSCIAPREDNDWGQRQVDFVNASVNLEFAETVWIVNNDNLWGRNVKRGDGVHLTEVGTSRLACQIKNGILEALEL